MDEKAQIQVPDSGSLQMNSSCLFLDVDGTLVDLELHPADVQIDDELLVLLSRLQFHLDGALALISGRPISELDRLFSPLSLPSAGIHGFERRSVQGTVHRPTVAPARLDVARDRLASLAREVPGILVEDRGAALALHYRAVPEAREKAVSAVEFCVRECRAEFELLEGSCVVEMRPAGHNKATAIEAFMQEDPFSGRIPIYIGDDRTDFDGFGAVRRHGGMDIAVGELVPARWRLDTPAEVRVWLQQLAAQADRSVT
jgi:trehalose 6-phosphate phosphatase